MLKKSIWFASALMACVISPAIYPAPVFLSTAYAADIQQYRRKYITFFQSQPSPLNEALQEGMQQELPRFTYQLMKTAVNMELLTFLQAVKRYQKEHAGQLAAMTEKDSVKFGDKVVPWSETKQVMDSAYVFAPSWTYSPIQLTGPHKHEKNNSTYWAVHVESDLTLDLDIYKLMGDNPSKYASEQEHWKLAQEIKLNNIDSLVREIEKATDMDIDLENILHRALVLEALKLLPEYKKILAADPAKYLAEEAEDKVDSDSFGNLAVAIKRLEDFILKGDVVSADMKADKVGVGFGDKETPASLGVKLDHGYKIIEYRLQGGQEVPVDVGFMKVREVDAKKVSAQPIIVDRDFELGDQVKEYPKTGFNVGLKAGTTSMGFSGTGESQNMFNPQLQLDIESNLAALTDVSELYGTLTGGVALPVASKSAPSLSALGVTVELGLLKKFYMRQLIFNAGIRGGVLLGYLNGIPGSDSYSNMSFGGTALVGAHYQATPDLIFGLDVGYRFFMGGNEWKNSNKEGTPFSSSVLGGLSSSGPVINLFANYAL